METQLWYHGRRSGKTHVRAECRDTRHPDEGLGTHAATATAEAAAAAAATASVAAATFLHSPVLQQRC